MPTPARRERDQGTTDEVESAQALWATFSSSTCNASLRRVDLADGVTTVGEAYTTYNPNKVRYADNASGVTQRLYDTPLQLGFNAYVAARF